MARLSLAILLSGLALAGCGDGTTDPNQPAGPGDATLATDSGSTALSDSGPTALSDVAAPTDAPPPKPAPTPPWVESAWLLPHIAALSDSAMEGRENLSPGGAKARAYLKAQMALIGLTPAGTDGFEQAFGGGVNLVGIWPGVDPALKDEAVVLSAHYDHLGVAGQGDQACPPLNGDTICHGATDNASGCAVALGVMTALAQADPPPSRSVMVLFLDGEEDALAGSAYFVDVDPRMPLADIAVVLNIDAVGSDPIPGVTSGMALGIEYGSGLRDLVQSASVDANFKTFPVSIFFDGTDNGRRSDYHSFWRHQVPGIFFSSGPGPEYHTPADDMSKVHPLKLAGTARHVLSMAKTLVNQADRPAFVADPAPSLDDARLLLAYGEAVKAAPEALDGAPEGSLQLMEVLRVQLQGYLDAPPQTPEEWAAYQDFIKSVIAAVHGALGR